MRRKRAFVVAGAFSLVVMLASTPSVAREREVGRKTTTNTSSRAVGRILLRSMEVGPKKVVTQRGRKNYAGPNCPGKHWNCTTASRVVQIATSGGKNRFECAGHAKDTCTTVQKARGGGMNFARCIQGTKQAGGMSQREAQVCSITQANTTGKNVVFVRQFILQVTEGKQQDALQQANVEQVNMSGSNSADGEQLLTQSADSKQLSSQSQNSRQTFTLDQNAATGTNSQSLQQSLTQDAEMRDELSEGSWKPSSQAQNALLEGSIFQASSGVSVGDNRQLGIQRLSAPPNTTQNQDPRARCCADQEGNPSNIFQIDQEFEQLASNPTSQFAEDDGRCFTSGTCTITQRAQQNEEKKENFVSGSGALTASIVCRGEGQVNECVAGSEGGQH